MVLKVQSLDLAIASCTPTGFRLGFSTNLKRSMPLRWEALGALPLSDGHITVVRKIQHTCANVVRCGR
jgi:hypothetical protein